VGRVEVVYVAHIPGAGIVSAAALAEIEINFDEVEQELRTEAGERLRGHAESWGFVRRQGMIADELIAVAKDIRDANASGRVAIVVGSSSHAMHRVVGSVAVSLSRHSPVPLVIVP
jgi:nucleotide-binding universal stress UspA family protein